MFNFGRFSIILHAHINFNTLCIQTYTIIFISPHCNKNKFTEFDDKYLYCRTLDSIYHKQQKFHPATTNNRWSMFLTHTE